MTAVIAAMLTAVVGVLGTLFAPLLQQGAPPSGSWGRITGSAPKRRGPRTGGATSRTAGPPTSP
ncbi:hypothetical protein AB4212_15150 [Streptomyces sp. 2MCAF27]